MYCTRSHFYFFNLDEVPARAPVWRYLHLSNRKSVPLHISKTYKSTDSYLIFRSGWVHNAVVWKVKTKKHLHNQSKDECHLIASYQLASYLLLASSLGRAHV